MASPQVLSLGKRARSISATSRIPPRQSALAAVAPAGPAPTSATKKWVSGTGQIPAHEASKLASQSAPRGRVELGCGRCYQIFAQIVQETAGEPDDGPPFGNLAVARPAL